MICDPENDCEFALLDFLCVLKQFFIKGAGEGDLKESYGRIKVAKVPSKTSFQNFLRKKKKKTMNIFILFCFFLIFCFDFLGRKKQLLIWGIRLGFPRKERVQSTIYMIPISRF